MAVNKEWPSLAVLVIFTFLTISCSSIPVSGNLNAQKHDFNSSVNSAIANQKSAGQGVNQGTKAKVIRVLDGCTIKAEIGDDPFLICYLGVEVPAEGELRPDLKFLVQESTLRNRCLVEGETVVIEKDETDMDGEGRLLRYVYLGKLFMNRVMLELGLARAQPYPTNLKYREQLINSESKAKSAKIGVWSEAPAPVITALCQTTNCRNCRH